MPTLTFRAYIDNRPITDTPAGDFARDARRDQTLPEPKTWRELRTYVDRKSRGHEGVRQAAYQVWRGYLRAVCRPPWSPPRQRRSRGQPPA